MARLRENDLADVPAVKASLQPLRAKQSRDCFGPGPRNDLGGGVVLGSQFPVPGSRQSRKSGTSSCFVTSRTPRSVILSAGMTDSARNDSVMNGSASVLPIRLAAC